MFCPLCRETAALPLTKAIPPVVYLLLLTTDEIGPRGSRFLDFVAFRINIIVKKVGGANGWFGVVGLNASVEL